MSNDNVIELPVEPVPDPLPNNLPDLVEITLIRLLREINSGRANGEGSGGLSIAEQTKILTAASDFLLKREKFSPPAKPTSEIDRLRGTLTRGTKRGARGR